jgi:HEAT repeat protein
MNGSLDDILQRIGDGQQMTGSEALHLGEIGDPRAVPYLINALSSANSFWVRVSAAQSLGKIRDPRAIPFLIAAWRVITDWGKEPRGDFHGGVIVAQAIRGFGAEALKPLLAVVRGDDPELRFDAAFALQEMGPPAVPLLLDALQDSRSEVRWAVVLALGAMGHKKVLVDLVDALRGESPAGRSIAAETLGKGKYSEAVPDLVKASKDDDVEVRRAAAFSLWAITGDERWRKAE